MANQTQNDQVKVEIIGELQSQDRSYDGREYTIYYQVAYLHRPSEHYPEKISFRVQSPNDSLKPGYYTIDLDASILIGQWNSLGFNRNLKLVPDTAPANAPVKATA